MKKLKFRILLLILSIVGFQNKIFAQEVVPAYSCEIKINGKVVYQQDTSDRSQCYRLMMVGSQNCSKYTNYFEKGRNTLEQFFNGTDLLYSDVCVK